MSRRVVPELIDDPSRPADELRAVHAFLVTINRRLGGIGALLGHLQRWSARWPRDRPVTLLDVGTGSADLPVAAAHWAREAGLDLRITGVDAHAGAIALARKRAEGLDIRLERLDARDLATAFVPGQFDYDHAGLLLHHLENESAVRVLRAMDRTARVGVVWNDLIRSARGLAVAWLATLPLARPLRHDTLVSLRAGFTRAEAESVAARAGLVCCVYAENFTAQRFTMAGEKIVGWPAVGAGERLFGAPRAAPVEAGRA